MSETFAFFMFFANIVVVAPTSTNVQQLKRELVTDNGLGLLKNITSKYVSIVYAQLMHILILLILI